MAFARLDRTYAFSCPELYEIQEPYMIETYQDIQADDQGRTQGHPGRCPPICDGLAGHFARPHHGKLLRALETNLDPSNQTAIKHGEHER